MHKYLIYALQDPRNGEIRYIGRSSSGLNRPRQHLCPSVYNKEVQKNYPVYNWVRKLDKMGMRAEIIVIQSFVEITNEELDNCEIYWISEFKKKGSPLLNLGIGGGGCRGVKWSEETRKKLSNRKHKPLTAEQLERKSKAIKESRKHMDMQDFARKVSEGTKKWWTTLDAEKRANCSRNVHNFAGKNKIKLIDQNGTEYKSLTEAAKIIGCTIGAITMAMKEDRACKGFFFRKI